MGIELKTVNPVVFDDPVYCCKSPFSCGFKTGNVCNLFHVFIDKNEKCQECKDHYIKNKPVEKEYCKYCSKEVDKKHSDSLVDGLGRWYCDQDCADSHFKSKGL
jgi:hypothetical protein